MNTYYDRQYVAIRVREEPYDSTSLWYAARVYVEERHPDNLQRFLLEETQAAGVAGYELHDSRHIEAIGAGAATHEVLLGIVGGTVDATVSTLLTRLLDHLKRQKEKSAREVAGVQYDPRRSTASARHFIETEFRPDGDLTAVEVSLINGSGRFVFEDSVKQRYIVEVDPNESYFLAQKISSTK